MEASQSITRRSASNLALAFVLLPHFWQTKWFLALNILAGIGLVAGTARYITWNKLQRKLVQLANYTAPQGSDL